MCGKRILLLPIFRVSVESLDKTDEMNVGFVGV